jgi:hypothetical protein
MHSPVSSRSLPPALLLVLLALGGFLVQALLWLNPGYFSHDELQWGSFADAATVVDLPWVGWTAVETFQFRPLTFNLWLPLSYLLFDTPQLFHAVFVALGTGNALLLFGLLRRRFGLGPALAGYAMFLLGPYTAGTHGWVATLADLLWVAAALLLAQLLEAEERIRQGWLVLAAFLLTGAGLLAKEAALSIPALLGLGWLLLKRDRRWAAALLGSSLAAMIYMVLRLAPIDAGSSGGSYAWSLAHVPLRLLEYMLFPWVSGRSEPVSMWLPRSSGSWLLTLSMFGLFVTAIARAGWHSALRWMLAGVLALGPTLLLGAASNQYAYGFGAVLAAATAQAWTRSRYLLLLPLLVAAWHGLQIQQTMHEIGGIQQRFHADLIAELQREAGTLHLLPDDRSWIYHRLAHQIPSYRGVPIGDRVLIVEQPEQATHRIGVDGGLRPAEPPAE